VSPDQLALAFAQLPQEGAAETDSLATESGEVAEDVVGETVRARPSPTGRKAFAKHLPRQRVIVMPATRSSRAAAGNARRRLPRR